MEIETRHLRLVKAVADEGSITRAASVLGTTQPALTRQLRRVEDNLGGPLFQRSRSGVEQTPLGRLVVGRANAVLSVIDSLQTEFVSGASLTVPSKDGRSYDCWNSSVPNSDPHYSSGVGNHFFFLLANGSGASTYGNSPTCNGSTVAGIGRDKATAIWLSRPGQR